MSGSHRKIIVHMLLIHFIAADWVEVSVLKPNVKPTTSITNSKLGFHREVENYPEMEGHPYRQIGLVANSSHDIEFNEKMLSHIQGFTMAPQPVSKDEQMDDQQELPSDLTAPDQVPEMLQSVHRTLMVENPNTPSSKIEFLRGLRNKILHKIKRSMENVWGPETRQARTSKMGHPSLESALMSISFLIFAVFLIKLIEQLIQSLSGGNYGNGNAAIMQVVPSSASIIGRKRRDVEKSLITARIITLMDDFPLLYTAAN